nr:hypothetical protein [Tanacetum cinerariifolium]
MPIDDWNRHIDFFLRPDQKKKSETNSKEQATISECTNGNLDEYPSLVSNFGLNHTSKATGTYVNEVASTKHVCLVAFKTIAKHSFRCKTDVWLQLKQQPNTPFVAESGKKLRKSLGKKIAKRLSSSFNKKLENILTQLAKKGMSLDKTLVVGEEDEEYEESDDEEMEVLDEDEDEDEEINDGDDYVE